MAHSDTRDNTYLETPRGLFTSAGNWFHITSKTLESYAPGLLEKRPLGWLVARAEVWIRSTDSLGIVLFMVLLYIYGWLLASLFTMLFASMWHINKSSFVTVSLTSVLRFIDREFVLVAISVAALSWMGITERYGDVFMGIVVFCVLKFGWFRWLVEWLYTKLERGQLLLNDRVLKMLIVQYALRDDIHIREVNDMEREILKLVNQQKEVFNKYRRKRS